MRDCTGHSHPRSPSWSKPLAPLSDWLDSVNSLLTNRDPLPPPRPSHPYRRTRPLRVTGDEHTLDGDWLIAWRCRLGLTPSQAADLLGYGSPLEIGAIERGYYVERSERRQMELVRVRAPGAEPNRSVWLHRWRIRMGLSTRRATEILGYSGTFNLYRAERGRGRPSWEKILIAIAEEQPAAGNDACQRTTPSDTRAILPSLGA